MKPPRKIKVTLDFLGVEIKCEFVRDNYRYKSPMTKTVAERCYQAAVRALAGRERLPEDTRVVVTRHQDLNCFRAPESRNAEVKRTVRCKDYMERMRRDDYSGHSELYKHFNIEVHINDVCDRKPHCTVNHEYLDWMFPESPQVSDQALRLTHEKPTLPTLPAATAARRVGSTAPGSLLALCDD